MKSAERQLVGGGNGARNSLVINVLFIFCALLKMPINQIPFSYIHVTINSLWLSNSSQILWSRGQLGFAGVLQTCLSMCTSSGSVIGAEQIAGATPTNPISASSLLGCPHGAVTRQSIR